MTSWVRAASIDRLSEGPVVFKQARRQIVVFQVDDAIFAIDNRCPHEGYPLAVGSISPDCVLTCNWHNWKFRLSDGECLVGGDHVRSYRIRVDAEAVWVDLAPPPPEETRSRILRGLRTAFDERDFGRICREIARLDFEGLDPLDAVRSGFGWAHDRLEFGATHATAAAADWLHLAARWPGDRERRLICLAEAVDHLAFDSLRHPVFPYAEAGERFDPRALAAAVESEDLAAAEGVVRRGLADGLHWPDMEEAFLASALAHYNSFGHSLIYVTKTGEVLERLGDGLEPFVLPPLVREIVYATREDRIPEFRTYGPLVEKLAFAATDSAERPEVPFPVNLQEAFRWLEQSLRFHRVDQVYDALLEALARSLLHCDMDYDTATDRPVGQNVGWLDFTHGLTFANAARRMCTRYPEYWPRALAQMACFLGRNHPFIDRDLDPSPWRVDDSAGFFDRVHEGLLDHGMRDPIFSAHHLKTTLAVEDELPHAPASCRQAMLDGLNRFLNSPIKMMHVRRNMRQAIALVARDYEG